MKFAAAGFAAAFSFTKIIEETKEAQAALSQLNVAFANSAESARRSKKDILDFAEAAQKSTSFSDESVTRAQTALLRFGRVSGDVFTRARKDILDVAAALGTDLESASFTVGRALESPSQGLRQLRALGVVFTDSQQKLIKSLEETGQTAKAQEIILQALEDRYAGAASAARNTLGGALDGLKNAFGDLFEATDQGASAAAEGINGLAEAISDPAFKSAVQGALGELLDWVRAFVHDVSLAVQGWQLLIQITKSAITPDSALDDLLDRQADIAEKLTRALEARDRLRKLGTTGTGSIISLKDITSDIDNLRKEMADVERQIGSNRQGQGLPQAIGSRQASRGGSQFISEAEAARLADEAKAQAAARAPIDLVQITQARSYEAQKVLKEFNDSTRTSLEAANADFEQTFQKLNVLLKEGAINAEQFQQRLADATIKYNDAVTIEPVKVSVQKVTETLSAQETRIHSFVLTLKEGLANLAQSGQLTGRAILRYLLASLESKLLYTAIENLGAALSKSLTKAAASTNTSGFIGSLLGSLFGGSSAGALSGKSGVGNLTGSTIGYAAGGGKLSNPRIVGEDGPELLFDSGRVMNRRQLAFAMGGGAPSVTIGDTQIVVQGASDPATTAQYVEARIQQNNRKQLEQISSLLKNNYGRALR